MKFTAGKDDFKKIRQKNIFYVDKTKMIASLLDSEDEVVLITRPRRFGKSLMLSTLREFFDIANGKDTAKTLFKDLSIMKRDDLIEEYMAEYPVLHFSFKDVGGLTYSQLIDSMLRSMQRWCKLNKRHFDFSKCNEIDVKLYNRIEKGIANPEYKDPVTGMDQKTSDIQDFLNTVIAMLSDIYEKNVILLLDEYDVPLAKASVLKGTVTMNDTVVSPYEAMKSFIAQMFGTAIKGNPLLERAVITGCMRIAQASIFTGANNFNSYGVMDSMYGDCIGFTDQEVAYMLEEAGIPEKMESFKDWYDGYAFGNSEIYCPWDVLKQIRLFHEDPEAEMKPHWLGTSENEILRQMLRNPKMNIEAQLAQLLDGGSLNVKVCDNVTYATLEDNVENLWNVLLQTGYLTRRSTQEKGSEMNLAIPNKEVELFIQDEMINWMIQRADSSQSYQIMDALVHHRGEEAARLLSQHLFESMSFFEYHEDFYHGFIGAYLKRDMYELEVDREYGLGKPDIVLFDNNKSLAVIIEVKHAKEEKKLSAKLKEAVNQCIREKYIEGVKTRFENVVCYGLATYKKQCSIQEVTLGA